MADERRTPFKWGGAPLDRRRVLLGLAAVGTFAVVDVGAVLYAAGWVGSGGRLTPRDFIEAFKAVNGPQVGFRKNHGKGVAVAGHFESNGAGGELTTAAVFQQGRTPVQGRFSLATGNHTSPDMAATTRGLGLAFGFPGGEQWRTAMVNLPVFVVNSPQGFYDQLVASKPLPSTGKPDPAAMARFQAAHPETVKAMALIKAQPPTSGFADSTFRGLSAFFFVNDAGDRTPVRWSFVPLLTPSPPTPGSSKPNFLFDDLVRRIRATPPQWRLLLTIGEPSDPTNDPTLPWPAGRRVIDAGTLTIDTVATEAAGNARDINFDPTVLPDGIERSDDPLLSPRSAVYSASYRLRAHEPKSAPAVNVDEVSQ
jgi:catalase